MTYSSDSIHYKLVQSIYNKQLEVQYNEQKIRLKDGKKVKLDLQGKIKCPILNTQISSVTCSKLMDKTDWPRGIDQNICKKCNCFIHLSIQKFKDQKKSKK